MLNNHTVQYTGHAVAGAVVAASWLDYAPKVAAVFGILWYCVLFAEKVRSYWNKKKHKSRRKSDKE